MRCFRGHSRLFSLNPRHLGDVYRYALDSVLRISFWPRKQREASLQGLLGVLDILPLPLEYHLHRKNRRWYLPGYRYCIWDRACEYIDNNNINNLPYLFS